MMELPANLLFRSHRWNRDISEWVKMSDDEAKHRREEEETRKREQEAKKNKKTD